MEIKICEMAEIDNRCESRITSSNVTLIEVKAKYLAVKYFEPVVKLTRKYKHHPVGCAEKGNPGKILS